MTEPVDPAEVFEKLWASGEPPDLKAFIARLPPLTTEQLAALVRIDQRNRHGRGNPNPAEHYLAALPALATDKDWAFDVVYHEYLLREEHGQSPSAAEFAARFPQYAELLADQIGLHNAIGPTPHACEPPTTLLGETPAAARRGNPRFRTLPVYFGRYRVVRLIGRGGMGDVYLAEDALLGRQVALKFPRFDGDAGGESLARFRREAQIAAGFHHPNLCPIYDLGQINGIWFLTMPYITGKALSALIAERGGLPENQATSVIACVARAMAVAHKAGVVHRDLKPSNILLKEDGQPVVTDFGLARRNAPFDSLLTNKGALVGTPAYMAPEQIEQDSDEVAATSDIYSLGVILYEVLAGRPPFVGRVDQVLRQILVASAPPITQAAPDVSPALEAVCAKAMSKEPADRFASMEEFARALSPASVTETIALRPQAESFSPQPQARQSAQTPGPAKQSPPSSLALSRGRILAVCVLAIIVAGACWSLWQRSDDSSPDSTSHSIDQLTAGSLWQGQFQFVGMAYVGEVQVTIKERSDGEFTGIYETENAAYAWAIKGTLRDEKIRWEFTHVVREKEPRFVVGNAYVEGACRSSQMKVDFHHRGNNTRAEMVLNRVK
jgi:serine/threonine protein kinase